MDKFDKNKFTKGDKKYIIEKFNEVKNNRAKNAIEKLIGKINELNEKGDKRLKNVYVKNLTSEQRNLMQAVGKLYNSSLPNKNTLKRNLALYVAYMHAKKPSPYPINWKGIESTPIGGQKRLSYKNEIFRRLQNYKSKKNISNTDLNQAIKLLEILRKGNKSNFIPGNKKRYDNFKKHFEGRRKILQNRSTRTGPAAAEVIRKQKSTPLRNIKFKKPQN